MMLSGKPQLGDANGLNYCKNSWSEKVDMEQMLFLVNGLVLRIDNT
jgi:hypothetical protein